MARIPDINVQKWMELVQSFYATMGPCLGVAAILALVGQQYKDARRMLEALPNDAYLHTTLSLASVRDELNLVGSRLDSYIAAMMAIADPPTLDDRINCERVYFWLSTGEPPDWKPGQPDLRMGDARLVATLWNQVAQAAVVNHEQNEAIPLPFGGTPEVTYAKEQLRTWLSQTAHAFEESAPGETPTLRDKAAAALAAAAEGVDKLIADAVENLVTTLKWAAAGAAIVLLLYLLLRK